MRRSYHGLVHGPHGHGPAHTCAEPELRERLKERLKAGDKGGRPGQWSVRTSPLLVRE